MIKMLFCWFKKYAVISNYYDLFIIEIYNGYSLPEFIVLNKNGLFQIASFIEQIRHLEAEKQKPMKNINIEFSLPSKEDEVDFFQQLSIPNWAKNKLFNDIVNKALENGWDRNNIKINLTGPYR